jgi:tetratricopeptide (TPR) repeat protein
MMRIACATIAALLPAAALYAQGAGIDPNTTRALTAVSEMGHPGRAPEAPRSLTFEESDDPTIATHTVQTHKPSDAARKSAQNAERLAKKNQHDAAAAMYREAVAHDPQYFEAWNNLALELEAAGKIDQAIDALRHLTSMAPEHVLGFANLVALLCRQHRYGEAEAVARAALKAHNYSFKANYMLGTVLVQEGKWTGEAKIKLEYAQVKYPGAKTLLDRWPVQTPPN